MAKRQKCRCYTLIRIAGSHNATQRETKSEIEIESHARRHQILNKYFSVLHASVRCVRNATKFLPQNAKGMDRGQFDIHTKIVIVFKIPVG